MLIKPNLMALDDSFPMPLYGGLTTTRLVEDMVILLKERGVASITVGEGSTYGRSFGLPTRNAPMAVMVSPGRGGIRISKKALTPSIP